MASDADLVRSLEKASAGIKDATKNMSSRIIRDAVLAVTESIRAILPRFEELAFGPGDGEEVAKPDDATAVEPVFEKQPPSPMGLFTERQSLHSIAESLKEIATLMRKDKEDRARSSVPGSGR